MYYKSTTKVLKWIPTISIIVYYCLCGHNADTVTHHECIGPLAIGLIGAGVKGLANWFGSRAANDRLKSAQDEMMSQYDRQLNELSGEIGANYLDRADSRNAIRKVTDSNTEALRQLNTEAIRRGATDEAKVAMAGQLAKRTADVVGDLSAQGAQYKDSLRQQKRGLELNKAMTNYQFQSNVSDIDNVLSAIGDSVDSITNAWTEQADKGGTDKGIKVSKQTQQKAQAGLTTKPKLSESVLSYDEFFGQKKYGK